MVDIKFNSNYNICRICLESGEEKLKKRCNCANKCHDSCLIKWIKVRLENNSNYLTCEICNSQYKFDKNISKLLNNNYKNYSILKLLILIFCLLLIITFYLLLYFYSFTYNYCKASFIKNKFEYFCCITIKIVLFYSLFYTLLILFFNFDLLI